MRSLQLIVFKTIYCRANNKGGLKYFRGYAETIYSRILISNTFQNG
jgi:hypothetical protein